MIENRLFELANLFVRAMIFQHAGDVESYEGHAHEYDHAHFVAAGVMDVEIHGQTTQYTAPAMIWIAARTAHKMTARASGTIGLCIHAIRNADGSGEPVDAGLIPAGSNAWGVARKN
jgi:mannose-6-phosphate isomerase-like protein (cupin superfamily)